MNITVGFEHSGCLSEALAIEGHNVTSIDILPGLSVRRRNHVQGDFFNVLPMIPTDALICFPPCTYLARCSAAHINSPGRRDKVLEALDTLKRIWQLPFNRIAIENPIGFASTNWRRPTQIVRAYQFGDHYTKDFSFWLKGLPELKFPQAIERTPGKLKRVQNHVNSRMDQHQKMVIKSSWVYYPNLIKAIVSQWFPFVPGVVQRIPELFD